MIFIPTDRIDDYVTHQSDLKLLYRIDTYGILENGHATSAKSVVCRSDLT